MNTEIRQIKVKQNKNKIFEKIKNTRTYCNKSIFASTTIQKAYLLFKYKNTIIK
tara:strand:- start:9 stop:170 length:162 start_codon:yes stop_codon:yes gene_type:complete